MKRETEYALHTRGRWPTASTASSPHGGPLYAVRGAAEVQFDDAHPAVADPASIIRYSYDEVKPYGAEQLRQAYLRAGDVIALVLQSRKGTAEAVPFPQTVTLQSRLLGRPP